MPVELEWEVTEGFEAFVVAVGPWKRVGGGLRVVLEGLDMLGQ